MAHVRGSVGAAMMVVVTVGVCRGDGVGGCVRDRCGGPCGADGKDESESMGNGMSNGIRAQLEREVGKRRGNNLPRCRHIHAYDRNYVPQYHRQSATSMEVGDSQ